MGWPSRCLTIHCRTPVCVSPATTTNSTPMTTTDVELKPEHASLASSTPATSSSPMDARKTTSARSFVSRSVVNKPDTVAMVIQAFMSKPRKRMISWRRVVYQTRRRAAIGGGAASFTHGRVRLV